MEQRIKIILVTLAMFSFAGNSLLNRLALASGESDPASFTIIRLVAASIMLSLLSVFQSSRAASRQAPLPTAQGVQGAQWRPWASAIALFIYAVGFSWAYVLMPAATGALILFGSVQLTMVLVSLAQGERLGKLQWLGFLVALFGLVQLTWPNFSTPTAASAIAMMLAGIAWGFYSLWGRGTKNPLQSTASNFLRTLPLAGLFWILQYASLNTTLKGAVLAALSGAITSGIGYAIWYKVLPSLRSSQAAIVQLSVPVITVLAGALLLGEQITASVLIACLTILGGMAVQLSAAPRTATKQIEVK